MSKLSSKIIKNSSGLMYDIFSGLDLDARELGLKNGSNSNYFVDKAKTYIRGELEDYSSSKNSLVYRDEGYLMSDQLAYLFTAGYKAAFSMHAKQYRKLKDPETNKKVPYIFHPIRVSRSCHNGSFILKSAALKHDTIEDTTSALLKEHKDDVYGLVGSNHAEDYTRLASSLIVGLNSLWNLYKAKNSGFIKDMDKMYDALTHDMIVVEALTKERGENYLDYVDRTTNDNPLQSRFGNLHAAIRNKKIISLVGHFSGQAVRNNLDFLLESYDENVLSNDHILRTLDVKKFLRRKLIIKFRDIQDNALTTGTLDDFGVERNLLYYIKFLSVYDAFSRKYNRTSLLKSDYDALINVQDDAFNKILQKENKIFAALQKDILPKFNITDSIVLSLKNQIETYPYLLKITTAQNDSTIHAGGLKKHMTALLNDEEEEAFYKEFACTSRDNTLKSCAQLLLWDRMFRTLIKENNKRGPKGRRTTIIGFENLKKEVNQ